MEFDSEPFFKDWDRDYLDDFQERKYKTDPNNPDTDKDGLLDGLEIKYGFNPKKADTDNDGILDGDEIISATMSYDESDWITKPSAKVRLKAKWRSSNDMRNFFRIVSREQRSENRALAYH